MRSTVNQKGKHHHHISRHRLTPRRNPWANRNRKSVDNDVLQLKKQKEKPAAERHIHGKKVGDTNNGEVKKKSELGPPPHHDPWTFRERGV